MGKVKYPNKASSKGNGATKSNQNAPVSGGGVQKRAKKRNPNAERSSDVSAKQTGSMKRSKQPEKAHTETTKSGWSVESGDFRPSNEGYSKTWTGGAGPNDKHEAPLRSNTSAKSGVVAFKRKALRVEDLYDHLESSDDSDWSIGDEFDESDYSDYLYDVDDFDDLPYQHVYSRKDFDSDDYFEYYDDQDASPSNSDLYSTTGSETASSDRSSTSGSNDSTDEDYEAKYDSKTIVIPHGSAVTYDLSDDNIEFDPTCKHGQIIELPYDYKGTEAAATSSGEAKKVEVQVANKEPGEQVDDDAEASDNSCPQTVPINPVPAAYQFFNAVDLRMSLAVLKSSIYLYGHLSVQVLFGKVEMLGYQLEMAEKRTVYASGGYNAINLTPLPTPSTFSKATLERVVGKLKPHFIQSDIDALVKQFDPATSVLVLLRADLFNASDTVPLVCKLLPDYNLFPTALTLDNGSPFRTTEMLLEIALFQPGAKNVPLFQSNPAWDEIQLKPTSRLIVVGGKGSGKSTLCQYLINRNIKQFGRVLLIDLDIGQPLLFLPETLSVSVVEGPILGVGCFADVQPHKCQLFGSFNVVSSPLVYVQNVRSLVQYCAEQPELKDIPWIINTMGYVVGFGEELTNAIIRLVQPTDLVQLTMPKPSKKQTPIMNKSQNYANLLKPEMVNGFKFNILQEEVKVQPRPVTYRFYDLEVRFEACLESFYPPRRRTIAIMSQLVKILGESAESFADVKPHAAHLDDLQILITRDEHRPSKEMLLSTLNATMVYLCDKLPNGQYNCFGVGIVRSVDEKEKTVYLLHSLTTEQLAKANVLALCNTSLPSQVYLQHSPNIEGTLPYLQNVTPPTTSTDNQSA